MGSCGVMSLPCAVSVDTDELKRAVATLHEERELSLYLFQGNEYQLIYHWSLTDPPLQTMTTLQKKSLEDERVTILLINHEYMSLISFNLSQRIHLFTKSSAKYSSQHLPTAATYIPSSDHYILSSTDSLSLLAPQHMSDTLTLQNLSLKVDFSRKYVNRDAAVFTSILSVSSNRSFIVLVSQSNSLDFPTTRLISD